MNSNPLSESVLIGERKLLALLDDGSLVAVTVRVLLPAEQPKYESRLILSARYETNVDALGVSYNSIPGAKQPAQPMDSFVNDLEITGLDGLQAMQQASWFALKWCKRPPILGGEIQTVVRQFYWPVPGQPLEQYDPALFEIPLLP